MRGPLRRALCLGGLLLVVLLGCAGESPSRPLTFTVTADMREMVGPSEFEGVVRAVAQVGAGSFMLSPGDIDPPGPVHAVIASVLGSSYPWFPVVGNHEAETPEDMAWLRTFNAGGTALPWIVNPGPTGSRESCYSIETHGVHITMINEYYDGVVDNHPNGTVSGALAAWLDADLAATVAGMKLVVGHEPAWPQPDSEPPYRLRHLGDSLDRFAAARDAFWDILVSRGVKAYICGHTHNQSIVNIRGVWQIDAGHARGTGDTGARSGFLRLTPDADGVLRYEVWRMLPVSPAGRVYSLADSGAL